MAFYTFLIIAKTKIKMRDYNISSINFIAIDVETATRNGGICQIGIVDVQAGRIVDFECLNIMPPGNKYDDQNIRIHGITPEKTQSDPTLQERWTYIISKLEGKIIVGHNIAFDLNVINKDLEYYNLPPFNPDCICTYALLNATLADCCRYYGIDLSRHHDAGCDAEACAKIMLAYLEKGEDKPIIAKNSSNAYFDNLHISSDTKKKDLSIVSNKDTIFYDKRVVITGMLDRYPRREDLALLLKSYGADINTSISKKTDIVIVGNAAGPKKLEKITSLQSEGYNIILLHEQDLYDIIDSL